MAADISVVTRLRNTPIEMKGVDVNPVTRPEVKLYKETHKLAPLDSEELGIFKAQFVTLLAAPGSEERRIMLDRVNQYVLALRAIKRELKDPKFKGLNPEDSELGFGHIRPVFTKVGGTVKDNWNITLTTSSTYQAWLGASLTAGYEMGESFGMVISHLKSLITPSPFMAEVAFSLGRTGILIPVDVRALRLGDTVNGVAIVPLPTMIPKPKTTLLATARADVAGDDEVQLGGLVIGLGRALKATTTFPTT